MSVFDLLCKALKRFNFEFRDFHDYYDRTGELILSDLLEEVTVSAI